MRVLFTPEAREAVEKVKVTPYVERVAASDNLRFALNGSAPTEAERPFGRATEAGTGGAQRARPRKGSRVAKVRRRSQSGQPFRRFGNRKNGASDGARTRDLRRDRPAL